MLNLPAHSLALLQRLKPLRDALAAIGVPVAYLPPEAGRFGTLEEAGFIEVVLPSVQAGNADTKDYVYWNGIQLNPVQEVKYSVIVQISLKTLYNNVPIDRPTVEGVVDEVCNLLCGFRSSPLTSELMLSSYSLKEPEGDRWVAILSFYFLARVTPLPPPPEPELHEIQVRLYNSMTLSAVDAVQVAQLPTPVTP